MSSVFTRVMSGDLPGRIIHADDACAAFLTVAPIRPGHTLVVPRVEVDSWLEAPDGLLAHLMSVSRRVGSAIQEVTGCTRVGLLIAGFEIAHLHLHVIPADGMADFDIGRADSHPDPGAQDAIAEALRSALDV